jgi:hypothetical protein
MRISEETRFPYPVLSAQADDFATGQFEVEFKVEEALGSGGLALEHEITLTEPAIRELVIGGRAAVGCFVHCNDTYFTRLTRLSWPRGRSEFEPGALLNRVTLRPMVWLEGDLDEWNPGTIHPEFDPPVFMKRGNLLALAPERVMSVGQAKFAPLESIFELERSPNVQEGRIEIDPDADRITILVASQTYDTINLLRGQANGLPVVLNAVYLPAVMEVLDLVRAGPEQYNGRRWFHPFMAKCDAKGIDVTGRQSIFQNAQVLLDNPERALALLTDRGES